MFVQLKLTIVVVMFKKKKLSVGLSVILKTKFEKKQVSNPKSLTRLENFTLSSIYSFPCTESNILKIQ